MEDMKLIIDVDTGVDDAEAIMMALTNPDVHVLAITCVSGNTGVDQAVYNTHWVLDLWKRPEVRSPFRLY
jgi:pyrimidine-specific ribonucleoside hydrolase